jgi:ribosomal protein S18 acetylase RimI-like enzyme
MCRIHDSARLDELRNSVGVAAFLPLGDTYEGEGLFAGGVWVAELEGAVVGFIGATRDEITWLYVDPKLYRRGIARALTEHVLAGTTRPVELEVLQGNSRARAFYESLGFVWTSSTSGKLAGNEEFPATGHTLRWSPTMNVRGSSDAEVTLGGEIVSRERPPIGPEEQVRA